VLVTNVRPVPEARGPDSTRRVRCHPDLRQRPSAGADHSACPRPVAARLADPDLCGGMSAQARASALEYTWRRCAEGSAAFYRYLIDGKRKTSAARQ